MRIYHTDAWLYKENSSDFLFWDIITLTEKLDTVSEPSGKVYSRNQSKNSRSRNFCTVVAPICAILSYRWEERTDKQRKELRDFAVANYGYSSDRWHYMHVGIDCARKYWNKQNPWKEMLSFRTERDSGEYWLWLSRWFHAVVWYRGNSTRNKDAHDNGILDKVNHWDDTYWHIRRESIWDETYIVALDNYPWRKSWNKEKNNYLVPRWNMDHLRRSDGTGYYPSAYFFLPAGEISRISPDVLKYILWKIQVNSLLRNKINNDPKIRLSEKVRMKEELHKENELWRAYIKKYQ